MFPYVVAIIICLGIPLEASNLANPVTPIPSARISIGVSYHLGGYTITNAELPSLLNRINARVNYAPLQFFNIGIDCGASQMEVAADTLDSLIIGAFHGNYTFSFGANIKLSSPLLNDLFGLIGIAQGTRFESENKAGALYKGYDVNGIIGFLVHIKNIGYIAAGPQVYLIQGKNKSFNSKTERPYSNVNNIRGWFAFDFFPKLKIDTKNIPYFSLEVAVSPDAGFGKKAPLQEISFSIAFGSVTRKLYGETSSIEWRP
jgi:hypothetical protein